MILLVTVLTSIVLGLSLIAIGGYLWLAAKKANAGLLLLAVGLILTIVPIALIAFFTITSSARG
jgi:hypothetical protein